jgi:PAS domain S-box-containing protein
MPALLNSTFLLTRRRWLVILLGLLCLILAHGAALIFRVQPAISLWFPPSGVAIALTLWFGPMGAVLTGVASLLMAPLWGMDGWFRLVGLVDAIEPLVAWFLYRHRWQGLLSLQRIRDASGFILSAPVTASMTSALLGSLVLVSLGKMPESNLVQSIAHWWLGNALGTLAIAPTALLVLTPFLQRWGWLPPTEQLTALSLHSCRGLRGEVYAILVFCVGTAAITVSSSNGVNFEFQQFSFLSFIPIVWAATRFGVTAAMLTSTFCLLATLLAYVFAYPTAISSPHFPIAPEVLYIHKLSLLVQCAVALLVGATITERTEMQEVLATERVQLVEHQVRAQVSEQLAQLNQSLTQANARLRRIVDSNIIGVFFGDLRGNINDANDAFLEIVGYTREDLYSGQVCWFEMTPPEYDTRTQQAVEELIERGVCVPFEKELIRKDGSRVCVLLAGALFEESKEQGVCYVFDLSEQKLTEAALRESEHRYSTLAKVSRVGLFHSDVRGNCSYTNERWNEIAGMTSTQALGKGWASAIHPEDRQHIATQWEEATQNCVLFQSEYRFRRPDGLVTWVLGQAAPYFGSNGEVVGYVGTITDISDRKQAELERQQLLLREQEARKNAESASRMKDEFLAIVSHELRSPLNAILGWSRLLRTRQFDPVKTNQALEAIERNAQAQAQLIEDLLDISRIIRGKVRLYAHPTNLVQAIEAALDTIRPTADNKKIQLETNLDLSVGLVSGDSDRLQQIIWNLLSNAVKFTPEGGRVEVRLERVGTRAQIKVIDTGKGINPDFLPYVFDRFRQADSTTTRVSGGLGLGLAIVRNLVELHGGTIQAESKGEGQGARFIVQLPLIPNSSLEPTAQGRVFLENSLSLNGLKVLIVDDEPDTREFLVAALEQYGAQASPAASADEALQLLQQFQPDVLVSDIGMPVEDGFALIRRVRALTPEQGGQIPAAALTAYVRQEDRIQALSAGFQMHVPKPIDPIQLIKVVANLARTSNSS